MMLLVSTVTILGLVVTQRNVALTAERDLRQNFQTEISALDKLQNLRRVDLTERCRKLAEKPRIHAALEDNALDLLYPSAKDELRDLMEEAGSSSDKVARSLHAKFYRFLDANGEVLAAPDAATVGELTPEAKAQLKLKTLPETQQTGYLPEKNDSTDTPIDEVIAVPIFSTDTGEIISALVVGFKPFDVSAKAVGAGMKSGIWVNGKLDLPSLPSSARSELSDDVARAVVNRNEADGSRSVVVNGAPYLLFYKQLNPGSQFPPGYEVCIYPLAPSVARQRRLRWQIGSAGIALLVGGFLASRFATARLSLPVEELALDSEENWARRRRAEAALETTTDELKRTARYSADASHQLKSPVTVLRVGIEALLAREDFKPEVYEELSTLLHQTGRLTGVIDDLLLLSQMDAGHLKIQSQPVNLSNLIDEWLDDLGALPDAIDVGIEKEFPPDLFVSGEKRYTSLIVQNLLENARKYNRHGGRLRVTGRKVAGDVLVTIGNTGRRIEPDAQKHLFERFHRGTDGDAVSGHGLGLNLARELSRLHGGDLRLVRSENDWTEFELRLRAAKTVTDTRSRTS